MNHRKSTKHRRKTGGNSKAKLRRETHPKVSEGKSNIIGKNRLTLVPGFLINGFTSATAKKCKPFQKTNENASLSENLQTFFDKKGKLRRSERISAKLKQNPNLSYKDMSPILPQSNNIFANSFKPILQKSKSIFKTISEQFTKIGKQTCSKKETQNGRSEEDANIATNRLIYNKSLNKTFATKIKVAFKRNAIRDCKSSIEQEIDRTNSILAGQKVNISELSDHSDNSDLDDVDLGDIIPLPAARWAYRTPEQRKIEPKIQEKRMEFGLLCRGEEKQELYAIPKQNREAILKKRSVRIDETYFKKLAVLQKSPENFDFKRARIEEDMNYKVQEPSDDFPSNTPIHPMEIVIPILGECQENPIFSNSENDFTFIADGNGYKIQESQSLQNLGTDRKEKPTYFSLNTDQGQSKMFDFGQRDKNLFDFGVN